jgi:V/A-type H+-transporting ATPase subunit D
MTKPALNKSSLKKEKDQLGLYSRYLPALDLKRRQFLFESKKAKEALTQTDKEIDELLSRASEWIPYLGDQELKFEKLVTIAKVHLDEENLLGVKLPLFSGVDLKVKPYSSLTTPLWFDSLSQTCQEIIEIRLRKQVAEQRATLLKEALQVITQRVNLFDKVLIPSAEKNIRSIQLALSEMERAGVIRSKLAKKKRQRGEH